MVAKTHWFTVDETNMTFKSRQQAYTLNDAFSKSISAWELREMGYYAYDSITTCGLCDVFKYTNVRISINSTATQRCKDCPITKYCQGITFCRDNKAYLDYQEAMDQQSEQEAAAEEVKFLKYLQSVYNS